jgi:hypothetical protein
MRPRRAVATVAEATAAAAMAVAAAEAVAAVALTADVEADPREAAALWVAAVTAAAR